MSLSAFTLIHVFISLVGLGSGFAVMGNLFLARGPGRWVDVFLISTMLTSATGFGFPFHGVLPSHVIGDISVAVLAMASAARYAYRLQGLWGRIFVIATTVALYLNSFVALVQAFQKVPALKAAAPTQFTLPFVAAQLVLLGVFIVVGSSTFRKWPDCFSQTGK